MGEVMVTGATGGIGQAITAALMAAGHHVSAVGRDLCYRCADQVADQLMDQLAVPPRVTW